MLKLRSKDSLLHLPEELCLSFPLDQHSEHAAASRICPIVIEHLYHPLAGGQIYPLAVREEESDDQVAVHT
jgi:hypothetical protein